MPPRRRITAVTITAVTITTLTITAVTITAGPPATPAQPAAAHPTAATPLEFDPGYIISDEAMSASRSMTSAEVQAFIEDRLPGCAYRSAVPCLRAYRSDSIHRAATDDGRCTTYRAGRDELASSILSRVARACRINPRVLLVMLQKEQGLITDRAPTDRAFRVAMGYGCPDTAPCDAEYYGFANQVYRAALQLRSYLLDPGYWRYRVGPVAIKYHPQAACGTSVVTIRNTATAALYNYTPYQPDAAALANPRGLGDACSSYGNRNFALLYRDWFGSPTRSTFGSVR